MHSATDYVTGYVSQYRVRKKSEESYRFSVKTLKLCFYRKANCLPKQTKKPKTKHEKQVLQNDQTRYS